ncbi:MAG TPA: xanthine dehydrogenase family protein subunit M [Acidobacteriota bacterium]|jgi:xanthine dehydrogenase YagS FAD-binding subunit
MQAFEYASATTKQQAVSLLSSTMGDAEILAGGTDILSLMKDDIVAPKRLVNIKEIKELGGIRAAGGGLRIGALVTIEELAESPAVRQAYPGLAQAAAEIAGPQIRHMATVGGNLCQRPRCWYFRNGFGLLGQSKDGKSLVLEGDNRYHAILGNSGPAYFVHPSSLAPALIALNARVRIFGPGGERDLPVEEFYSIPKSASDRENVLQAQEVVTEVMVPAARGVRGATYEVRQKDAFDWPLALASVALKMSGAKVQSARVVMGHVAPVPWRSQEAEQALVGKSLDETSAKAAGEAAVTGARDLGHNAYKIQLAKVAVKRAILQAAKRTLA